MVPQVSNDVMTIALTRMASADIFDCIHLASEIENVAAIGKTGCGALSFRKAVVFS